LERQWLRVIAIDDKPLLTVTRPHGPEAYSPEAWRRCGGGSWGGAIARGGRNANPATVLRLGVISLGLLLGAWIVQRLLVWPLRRCIPQAMVPTGS